MEFADGISALVGPNGSGKSNIVDAIKWVLGEQSVKKLRGNDMTDVIFNGSASRTALGAAEVALTFDNTNNLFALDVPEVQITRRVYRSGEGEYLINKQPTRLKDIKDLLSGTGLGTQAYSIIEQGRVEALLQSSGVQRRGIFDDAAGISRFNSKKLEIERRLQRVEQNLSPLIAIESELANQLRVTKAQAGKAEQYRQYSERLKTLRTEIGRIEWSHRDSRLKTLRTEIETLTVNETTLTALVKQKEQHLNDIDDKIATISSLISNYEGEIAAVRERIRGADTAIEVQRTQINTEIKDEIERLGKQLHEWSTKSVNTDEMMRESIDNVNNAQSRFNETSNRYRELNEQTKNTVTLCNEVKAAKEDLAKQYKNYNDQKNKLLSEIAVLNTQIATLNDEKKKFTNLHGELETKRRESLARCDNLTATIDEETSKSNEQSRLHEEAKERHKEHAAAHDLRAKQLSEAKEQRSGRTERIRLIEELLRKSEGLSQGVREVLELSRQSDSPFRFAHGLVADILRVDVDAAMLIEQALGLKAQHVVVSPQPELFRYVEQNSARFSGRVGFIWLDPNAADFTLPNPSGGLFSRSGVLGRADYFVKTEPQYLHLAHRLLGRTWIVESLVVAKQLYKESDDRTNFITVHGELLEADGTLVVGPTQATARHISRRSELRTLYDELTNLESQVTAAELDVNVLRKRIAEDARNVEQTSQQYQKSLGCIESLKHQLDSEQNSQSQIAADQTKQHAESERINVRFVDSNNALAAKTSQLNELESVIKQCSDELEEKTQEFSKLELQRQQQEQNTNNAKIEQARAEAGLTSLKSQIEQFEVHQRERQELLSDNREQIKKLQLRRDLMECAILRYEAGIASLFAHKEEQVSQLNSLLQERGTYEIDRKTLRAENKSHQDELKKCTAKLHECNLEQTRLTEEQRSLAARLKEDGIDLIDYESTTKDNNDSDVDNNKVSETSEPLPNTYEEYQSEIELLRKKLTGLGNVNLEAIDMLNELETKHDLISNQIGDLKSAKGSIEKAIEQVNAESNRLFNETFEGIRVHFSELFQRLFGGGHADLVFEDETNTLESGVDIVARPPGKELKSVSLLSGGEKTLTCVALLLAMFRFRPNPICILDECDAALDEGNIDRFVKVISDFRDTTQFLIVTHSKKTMACASAMYGVTMQESGISKLISVRYVDVGDNGEINDVPKDENEFSIDTRSAA
jgi:chromosome segregation protein